jgi:hypothetical protein
MFPLKRISRNIPPGPRRGIYSRQVSPATDHRAKRIHYCILWAIATVLLRPKTVQQASTSDSNLSRVTSLLLSFMSPAYRGWNFQCRIDCAATLRPPFSSVDAWTSTRVSKLFHFWRFVWHNIRLRLGLDRVLLWCLIAALNSAVIRSFRLLKLKSILTTIGDCS